VIEPVCGSESITLVRECQGFVNHGKVDGCPIESPEKTRPTEEIAVLMCALILDGKFPQSQPLPGQ